MTAHKALKVAVLSRHFSKIGGGAESYAVHLAHAMLPECEITVVSQSFDESPALFKHLAVTKLPIKTRWLNQWWFSWQSKKLTARGFDVVHSHENVTHGDVQTVHVKTVHASLQQKGLPVWRTWLSPRLLCYLWLEKKRLCSLGQHPVFVSQMLLNETREALPCVHKASVIAPGVTVPEASLSTADRQAARNALSLQNGAAVIGFVGHDFKKKGLATLLKAAALLPFDVQIVVIGNPAHASDHSALVQALGVGKTCQFLGLVRNMPQAYAAFDCLAHPTTQDVFPMVLLEAMAQRVPVVTTAAPFNSMANLLRDGLDALLIADPHDHNALAQALVTVIQDGDLRRQLSDNGFKFASNYSWNHAKAQYYRVYQAAMAEQASR